MTKMNETDIGATAGRPKTSTRGLIVTGVFAFLVLFCVGGMWLSVASISGAVIASGSVFVEGEPKEVQHLDGGIVSAITVADGQFVDEGDVVIMLDDTVAAANVDIYRSRLSEAFARRARLAAERHGSESIAWPGDNLVPDGAELTPDIKVSQSALFNARRKNIAGKLKRSKRKISQFRSQIDGIRAQKSASLKQLNLHVEELAAKQKLRQQGHASQASLRNLQKQLAFFEGEIGEAIAEEARAFAAIDETEIAMMQTQQEFAEQVLTEIARTDAEIREGTQQYHAARKQLVRTKIRAPSSGLVHKLSVMTVGGVVGAGSSLMQIVPQDRKLKIAIAVEPQYIDDITMGQDASVRLSAFSRNEAIELNGRIDNISATTMINDANGAAYYKAVVAVDKQTMEANGQLALVPGMPVEVFIKTTERTALSYLIKPALDQINRAMREQ